MGVGPRGTERGPQSSLQQGHGEDEKGGFHSEFSSKQSWGQKENCVARQGLILFFCSCRAKRFPPESEIEVGWM